MSFRVRSASSSRVMMLNGSPILSASVAAARRAVHREVFADQRFDERVGEAGLFEGRRLNRFEYVVGEQRADELGIDFEGWRWNRHLSPRRIGGRPASRSTSITA